MKWYKLHSSFFFLFFFFFVVVFWGFSFFFFIFIYFFVFFLFFFSFGRSKVVSSVQFFFVCESVVCFSSRKHSYIMFTSLNPTFI